MEKKLKLRTADQEEFGIVRKDSFLINPLKIVVDFSDNPREYYGSEEDQEDFKTSIKTHGVRMPVTVTAKNGDFHLTHGFRRMKAVLSNIEDGFNIESVPVFQVDSNEEQILIDHIVLNDGKPFNDHELAKTLNQITILMGRDDFAEISRRVGIHQVKVGKLINFARRASTQVKDAVKSGEIAISTAVNLVKKLNSISDQNEALDKAKKLKAKIGDKKIRVKHINVLGAPKRNENAIERLRLLTVDALTSESNTTDKEFAKRVLRLVNSVSGSNTLEDTDILELFNLNVELV